MPSIEPVDVAVIGAGPAGCSAALRLLQMGRSVTLIERMAFPRPQIGESLSPGIWNILDYLDATDAITAAASIRDLPARVAWESGVAEVIPPSGGGLMVDRGDVDLRLLAFAKSRGASSVQPGWPIGIDGYPDAWDLQIESDGRQNVLRARFIIDARGRAGVARRHSIPLAPPTIAVWAHVAGDAMPFEIRVEALDRGWMWGAPLPNRQYRVMAFLDASVLKRDHRPEEHLRSCLGDGELFQTAAAEKFLSVVTTCSTTPFLNVDFAKSGRIKVGENALALDPLSSSGVEKSMRLGLQGAVVANTILHDSSKTAMAMDFLESRVIESAATHSVWTRSYHQKVLLRFDHEFWQERAAYAPDVTHISSHVADRFFQACERVSDPRLTNSDAIEGRSIKGSKSPSDMSNRWEASVSLSPALSFADVPCVIGDRLELREAILHPSLSEPIAFLGGQELAPLLSYAATARNLGHLLAIWSSKMPQQTALLIAAWLDRRHILQLRFDNRSET